MSTTTTGNTSAVSQGASKAGKSFSHSLFPTLWRAFRAKPGEELPEVEAASSFFRFFHSKHVADLKRIAYLALSLFSLDLVFVLVIAYLTYIAPTPESGTQAAADHTIEAFNSALKVLAQYLGPAITICGAVVAWSFLSTSTRLGVVDLFACEVSTLCRVGTIFDIGKRYNEIYHSKDSIATKGVHARKISDIDTKFVSQESYFPVFENNAHDLEALEALVVGHITEFYTYMKAARDLQRKLASLDFSQIEKNKEPLADGMPKEDPWHETVANIIYVLFLGYESARKAVDDLIEFQPKRTEEAMIILLTELACFSFLCEYLKANEIRYGKLERQEPEKTPGDHVKYKRLKEEYQLKFNRLELREAEYNTIIEPLISMAKGEHQFNPEYWIAAQRTAYELDARYKSALDTLEKCRQEAAAAAA